MADTGFPYDIKPADLQDPSLGRLNRAFQYLWTAIQKLTGDKVATHFLNGSGAYTTPLSPVFPKVHTATGEPGQVAYDTNGSFYFCYKANSWARLDASGYSNTF